MELREAAQMALDYLDAPSSKVWAAGTQYKIIQALRAALAQPEQEIESDRPHAEDDGCPTEKAVLQRFWREHHAQPEQEPTRSQKMRDAGITRRPKGWDKEQELEGINEVILNSIRDSSEVVAPPQREGQGLTDEEIMKITGVTSADSDWNVTIVHKWIRAIEAKLREKNFDRPS